MKKSVLRAKLEEERKLVEKPIEVKETKEDKEEKPKKKKEK